MIKPFGNKVTEETLLPLGHDSNPSKIEISDDVEKVSEAEDEEEDVYKFKSDGRDFDERLDESLKICGELIEDYDRLEAEIERDKINKPEEGEAEKVNNLESEMKRDNADKLEADKVSITRSSSTSSVTYNSM